MPKKNFSRSEDLQQKYDLSITRRPIYFYVWFARNNVYSTHSNWEIQFGDWDSLYSERLILFRTKYQIGVVCQLNAFLTAWTTSLKITFCTSLKLIANQHNNMNPILQIIIKQFPDCFWHTNIIPCCEHIPSFALSLPF